MLDGRKDSSKVGLMYLCTFTLLKLSGERSFGVALNQPYQLTLPVDVPPFTGRVPFATRVFFFLHALWCGVLCCDVFNSPQFYSILLRITTFIALLHIAFASLPTLPLLLLLSLAGNYSDLLVIVLHKMIVSGLDKLSALYNCFLTIICNVSPYCKCLGTVAAVKIVNLFQLFMSPRFLYATESNSVYVALILETLNNIVQYQYEGNVNIVYAVIKRSVDKVLRCSSPLLLSYSILFYFILSVFSHVI